MVDAASELDWIVTDSEVAAIMLEYSLIQENQPEINKILLDFGVPLLDENDQPISAENATKSP